MRGGVTTSSLADVGNGNHIFWEKSPGEIPDKREKMNDVNKQHDMSPLDILMRGVDDLSQLATLNHFFVAVH